MDWTEVRAPTVLLKFLVAASFLFLGCDEDPPPSPPPPPPPKLEPIAAPRSLATDSAFDLVATSTGAALFWGQPRRVGAGIQMLELDRLGRIRSAERPLLSGDTPASGGTPSEQPADVVELAAAFGGGRYGVAWVLREPFRLRVQGALGRQDGTFGPPIDFGTTEMRTTGRRGHLALAAAANGTLSLVARGVTKPCSEGRCTEFSVQRMGEAGDALVGVPLLVPNPCRAAVTGHLNIRNTWYYAVCAKEHGVPVTTLYATQSEPEYVHTERLLPGCSPLGMTAGPEGVVHLADCEGRLEGVEVEAAGRRRNAFKKLEVKAPCVDGHPMLEIVSSEGHDRKFPLRGPKSRVESLLPSEITPPRTRAVWTGDALLLAYPLAGDVGLRRYECRSGHLMQTNE